MNRTVRLLPRRQAAVALSERCVSFRRVAAEGRPAWEAWQVGKLAVSKLVATSLVAAVALPMALLMAASLIDTPWAVAMDRAMKARSFAPHLPSHAYAPNPHASSSTTLFSLQSTTDFFHASFNASDAGQA